MFKDDLSAHLAIGIQDVEFYRENVKENADFLNDRDNAGADAELRNRLDYLFSVCATLAVRIDQFAKTLKEDLDQKRRLDASSPAAENVALPATEEVARFALTLRKLVKGQLAPALQRLIAYHKGGEAIAAPEPLNSALNEKAAPWDVLGGTAVKFSTLKNADLSEDWTDGGAWAAFYNGIASENSVYGVPLQPTAFERINHFATHNLFTSILEQFLKAYSRIVNDAQVALEASLTNWSYHEPHYALFLAFLRLFAMDPGPCRRVIWISTTGKYSVSRKDQRNLRARICWRS